jgi:hypothetical protein
MIKVLALFTSLFLFAGAWSESSLFAAFGGLFFLILATGAYLKSRFMWLFIGLAMSSVIVMNLISGEAFRLCFHRRRGFSDFIFGHERHFCEPILLANDPDAFWQQMIFNSLFVICVICFGLYMAYYKKAPEKDTESNNRHIQDQANTTVEINIDTSALMKDLERIAVLLDIESSTELKEKSALLFSELDEKYKDDELAKPSIEDSKVFFSKEIQKREESEST